MHLTYVGRSDINRRAWLLGEAQDFDELAAGFTALSRHFVLFVAADCSSVSDATLERTATALVRLGASYACAWGPDAHRLEVGFDLAATALDLAGELPYGPHDVIMTVSDEDVPLEEALWFAATCAYPTACFEATTSTLVTVAVGSDDWRKQIAAYLEAGAPMRDEA